MKPEDRKYLLIYLENRVKFYCEFIEEITNSNYKYGRISIILESSGTCCIDGIKIQRNIVSTIQRYYESTSDFNRSKFTKMINNNIDNIPIVYDLILTANGVR